MGSQQPIDTTAPAIFRVMVDVPTDRSILDQIHEHAEFLADVETFDQAVSNGQALLDAVAGIDSFQVEKRYVRAAMVEAPTGAAVDGRAPEGEGS